MPDVGAAGLLQVLQSMTTMQDAMAQQAKSGATPGIEITTKTGPDGTTHSVDMADEDLKTIMGTLRNYAQVMDAYQKEIGRLEMQQAQIQKNPILNVLATVGGATALQDKRLPPVVRAMGEASMKLNPTFTELEDRKLAIGTKMAQMGGQEANLLSTIEARKASAEDRRLRTEEMQQRTKLMDRAEKDRVLAAAEARSDLRYNTALKFWQNEIDRTHGKEVSQKDFEAGMRSHGVLDKAKIADAYESYKGAAGKARESYKEQQEQKQRDRENTPGAQRLAMEKEQTRAVAEHLVEMYKRGDPRMLESLKTVSGAFGGQKRAVMAEILKISKEQGIDFSEAKVERMIKTEDQFSSASSKEGAQLISFNTFAQHAGALKSVYDNLAKDETNVKILNKGWNWIKLNAGKDARVAQVYTALEPVKKEFESFLLGNRALYEVDRKTADQLLDPAMPPSQFMASLGTMGHTVEARYGSLNTQYQNVMGVPLSVAHPLDPNALAGLRAIGVNMQVATDPMGVR